MSLANAMYRAADMLQMQLNYTDAYDVTGLVKFKPTPFNFQMTMRVVGSTYLPKKKAVALMLDMPGKLGVLLVTTRLTSKIYFLNEGRLGHKLVGRSGFHFPEIDDEDLAGYYQEGITKKFSISFGDSGWVEF